MDAEDDTDKEKDKGPLIYQESKVFGTEPFLCNVYDNQNRRYVTFEVYGLDNPDTLTLGYDYTSFDKEFRFNAELMNPNRKEGRFHWVIERLSIVTVGKERKLQRKPEPTEEVPLLPTYETQRKIPTGRMDLAERQRLREAMDMLDIKRTEAIAKKRKATKERFNEHIMRVKREDARKKKEVEEKIVLERAERAKKREEEDKRDQEEQLKLRDMAIQRRKAVEVHEARTDEQDEEDYRALRERWRVLDAEKASNIKEARQKQAKEKAAQKKAEEEDQSRKRAMQAKREATWKVRAGRIEKKEAAALAACLEKKAELQLQDKMRRERNQEFITVLHSERQPIFKEVIERTQNRQDEQEQEKEAVARYVEKRAIPKREKYKGLNAVPKPGAAGGTMTRAADKTADKDPSSPKKAPKKKPGKKKDTDGEGEPEEKEKEKESDKSRTDRVLDAVEAKVRAEMQEEQRRGKLQGQRSERIEEADKRRFDSEVQHMKEYREQWRQQQVSIEQQAAERKLIMRQREEERVKAAERKKQELERLQRVREHNMARKEAERLAARCA